MHLANHLKKSACARARRPAGAGEIIAPQVPRHSANNAGRPVSFAGFTRQDHKTDPELKHLAGIGGARSERSRVASTKKRADLGSSCHARRSRQSNSRCRRKRSEKVTKTRPDVTGRKASPDAPDFFLIFFGRVDPNTTRSRRQTPPIGPL